MRAIDISQVSSLTSRDARMNSNVPIVARMNA